MKEIEISYLPLLNSLDAFSASKILDNSESNKIDQINWFGQFPYCPETKFFVAFSNEALFVKFIVAEKNVRAIYLNDQEPVWQDSCVEFFCKKPDSDSYINFEFNCLGTCLSTKRKNRNEDVIPFSDNQMKLIDRFSSLKKEPVELIAGMANWNLTVKIPFAVLEIEFENLPEYLKVNFYKCGDYTLNPHYVSWNPILTENPDFHCPEYFGKLIFNK